MKKHFITLFDAAHRWWTLSFFLVAIAFIVSALIVGITGNLPGNVLLISGMMFFFASLLHAWKKWEYFAAMAGIFFLITLATWIVLHYLNLNSFAQDETEKWVMIIITLVLFPGTIVGILGAFYRGRKNDSVFD